MHQNQTALLLPKSQIHGRMQAENVRLLYTLCGYFTENLIISYSANFVKCAKAAYAQRHVEDSGKLCKRQYISLTLSFYHRNIFDHHNMEFHSNVTLVAIAMLLNVHLQCHFYLLLIATWHLNHN